MLKKLKSVISAQEIRKFEREKLLFQEKLVFNKKETAEMLGISPRTLDRRRDEGVIFSLDNVEKGKVLYSRNEIYRVIENLSNHGR